MKIDRQLIVDRTFIKQLSAIEIKFVLLCSVQNSYLHIHISYICSGLWKVLIIASMLHVNKCHKKYKIL